VSWVSQQSGTRQTSGEPTASTHSQSQGQLLLGVPHFTVIFRETDFQARCSNCPGWFFEGVTFKCLRMPC
jgi:hypothetical protein